MGLTQKSFAIASWTLRWCRLCGAGCGSNDFFFFFLTIKVAVLDGKALVMTSAHGLKEKRWLTDSQFTIGRDGHNRCHDGDGHQ